MKYIKTIIIFVSIVSFCFSEESESFLAFFCKKANMKEGEILEKYNKSIPKKIRNNEDMVFDLLNKMKKSKRDIIFSIYVDKEKNYNSVFRYYEKYKRLPSFIPYIIMDKKYNIIYKKDSLEKLIEKCLVDSFVLNQRKFYETNTESQLYFWDGAVSFFLKEYPNNMVIKRVISEYPYSVFCKKNILKDMMASEIINDKQTITLLRERKKRLEENLLIINKLLQKNLNIK